MITYIKKTHNQTQHNSFLEESAIYYIYYYYFDYYCYIIMPYSTSFLVVQIIQILNLFPLY